MKKICFFTGTRAEFGLLRPLMQAVKAEADMELQIVAMAMHMSPEFGLTYQEIEEAGFEINQKIESLVPGDDAAAVNKSMAMVTMALADVLPRMQPDIAIILGDRSEMLATASACAVANIPIAHIHGGEVTAAAYDDAFRHAITKMSYWHFTSTEPYRRRVIQLGEDPSRVHNVGAIGIDSIRGLDLMSREQFEESIDFTLGYKNFLLTYHPVTLGNTRAHDQINAVLSALESFPETHVIFTYANSDKDGMIINKQIENYVQQNPERTVSFQSLGQLRYLSALQYVDAVIGNSSSGIIEVPYFGIATVNIGDRQAGRIFGESVIQSGTTTAEISEAMQLALEFKKNKKEVAHLYGDGHATEKIMEVLRQATNPDLKKGFYDVNFEL